MSITRLQQARQMYAMGQRVAKTLDGSRPGYRGSSYGPPSRSSSSGPAGGASSGGNYGGNKNSSQSYSGSGSTGRERGADRNRTTSTRTTSTPKGPTNIHGDGGGTTPYTYIGGKKYDVTPTTRNERDRATLKQQILNQTKLGGNRIDKYGNTKKSPFRQGGGLGSLLMGALGMFMGIPGLGLLTGGIRNLGGGLKDLNRKFRGVNPDGTTRTQAQYEKARFDRQQQKRLDKLFAAKDRGYNQIGFGDFTKKTMDFTPGQQAKIDELLAQGYTPSTARNVLTGRDLNLRNNLNSGIQNLDLNKLEASDLNNISSLISAAETPKAQAPQFMFASPQFKEGLDNTMYGGDRMLFGADKNQLYYDGDVLPGGEVYESDADGITNYGFDTQPQEGIMGIDVGYPSNDLMAKVSAQDLARYSQQGNLTRATDYETAMDTIYSGSQMTPYEYNQLQQGNITQPGTYIG